jgi:hypothetical protein
MGFGDVNKRKSYRIARKQKLKYQLNKSVGRKNHSKPKASDRQADIIFTPKMPMGLPL